MLRGHFLLSLKCPHSRPKELLTAEPTEDLEDLKDALF